jgi:hypothetical protein
MVCNLLVPVSLSDNAYRLEKWKLHVHCGGILLSLVCVSGSPLGTLPVSAPLNLMKIWQVLLGPPQIWCCVLRLM